MKKFWVMFVVSFLAGSGATQSFAANPASVNVLCINRMDGVQEKLMIDAALDVAVNAEGSIVLTHPAVTVELPAGTVRDFTLARDYDFTETYVGDHQAEAGIEASEVAPEPGISVTPDGITSGKDILVFDLKGVQVAAARVDGGVASLAVSSLPKGVYIVKSGVVTLKIKI